MIDFYIEEYGKRLFGLCLALCANRAEAEDLYQDTWLRVLQNIDRYDPKRPFEPWLTRICVNTYRNRLRRLGRSPIFNGFASTEEKDRFLEASPAEVSPDYNHLYEAVDRLPDKLRMAVILFYFQDLDLCAVADTLSIPMGTVKSRLNRAKKKLKEVLQSETDLPF